MPKRPKDTRTQKERAKAIGITDRSWRNYVKKDARFAQLVTRGATDDELIGYLHAKKNGLPFALEWEDDATKSAATGDGSAAAPEDLHEVARRTKIARMEKLEEVAKRAEIERRKIEGTLIPVEAVAKEYGRAMTNLKNSIMAIAPSIRGELLQFVDRPADAAEVEQIITEACRSALEAASQALKKGKEL